MTLEIFSRDVIPIIQTGILLTGLVSLFLLWWQNRQINIWNKLSSPFNFIDIPLLSELKTNLFESSRAIDIDPHSNSLSYEDYEKIYDNDDMYVAISSYLNYLENISTAVNIGSVDQECAYAVHANGMILSWVKYEGYIKFLRDKQNDDEVFIEIEKASQYWMQQDALAIKKRKRHKKVSALDKGAQRKV